MWIYLSNSYLSIAKYPENENLLSVEARRKEDIEAVFPEAEIKRSDHGKFKYHTLIDRLTASLTIAQQVANIDYFNLSEEIADKKRYSAYRETWGLTRALENPFEPDEENSNDIPDGMSDVISDIISEAKEDEFSQFMPKIISREYGRLFKQYISTL